MANPKDIKPGTQIVYVPSHLRDQIKIPADYWKVEGVEFGFVTSVRNDVAFCRYFYSKTSEALRTIANSEATPLFLLDVYYHHRDNLINSLMKMISNDDPYKDWDVDPSEHDCDEAMGIGCDTDSVKDGWLGV